MAGERGLQPRQRAFVTEYLKDHNGAQAAIRAGYSVNGASVQAHHLLSNPKILGLIEAKLVKAEEKAQINVEEIVGELAEMFKAKTAKFIKIADGGRPYYDFTGATQADLVGITELTTDVNETPGSFDEDGGEEKAPIRVIKTKVKSVDRHAVGVSLLKHLGGQFRSKEEPEADAGVEIKGGLPE